jgi:fusion and transport protein UGO1
MTTETNICYLTKKSGQLNLACCVYGKSLLENSKKESQIAPLVKLFTMSTDHSHPFSAFPAGAGKGEAGLRPYYTPGLGNGNYTSVIPDAQTTMTSPYYTNEYDDLIDSRAAARELINFTVLKYLTTAVSSPFEVSKTLLQVQYMPREDAEVTSIARTTTTIDSDDEGDDQQQQVRLVFFFSR